MSRKLTNRYDVVQMGDTPGFWDSISERLDQYLDPNFQRQLKLDEEEQRRYIKKEEKESAIRTEEQKRYNDEQNKAIGEGHKKDIMSLDPSLRGSYINELKKESNFSKYGIPDSFLNAITTDSERTVSFSESMNRWRNAKTTEDRIKYWREMGELSAISPNFQSIMANNEVKHEKYLQKAENKKVVSFIQSQYPDIISESDIRMLGDIDSADIDILTTKIKNSLDASKASEDRKQKLVKTFLDYGKGLDIDASDQQLNTARALEALALQLSVDYLPKSEKGKGGKKDISYGIQPTFDPSQVRDNDLVELGGQKLSGKRLKEILKDNPISDEELSKLKISRLGNRIGIGRKQDPKKYNPTLLGTSVPSLKELRKEAQPINIATKKQIDKEAERLGWDDKINPKSVKFQLILEELEKRFPNYNFEANQIESD